MKDYVRIAAKIRETPWLITPEGLNLIMSIMDARINDGKISDEELAMRLEAAGTHGTDASVGRVGNSSVGVIPLYGPIFGKANLMTEMSGATSMDTFRNDFKAMLADESISSIIMDIDSPGGTVEQIAEAGAEIYNARETKPVYAIANSMSGSAAFWLMSQAEKAYVTPSGSVGSIGVYTVHEDQSGADAQQGRKYTYISAGEYKTEGNPHEPLSAEGAAYRKEVIDEIYGNFLGSVATGRNVSANHVKEFYGKGRMLSATKALEAGMVDGIKEFDAVVGEAATAAAPKIQVAFAKTFNGSTTGSSGSITTTMSTGVGTAVLGQDGVYYLEVADWEHSDPGTGDPPAPRTGNEQDKAIQQGWRRGGLSEPVPPDDPGAPKPGANAIGGNGMTPEQRAALMALFKIDANAEDADELLVAAVTEMHTVTETINNDVTLASEEQELAKRYPNFYAQHKDLLASNREKSADMFVESVKHIKRMDGEKLVPTSSGLSALALDTVRDTHMKFASGTVSLADFEKCVRTMTDGGTVDYGEHGSALSNDADLEFDTSTATGVAQARNAFAAEVAKIQSEDKLDYRAALAEAAKRFPTLAAAYRSTTSA